MASFRYGLHLSCAFLLFCPRTLSSYPCDRHTPLPAPAIRKIRKHWKLYLPLIPLRGSSSFWGTFNLGKISFRTRLQKPEKCFLLFFFGQEDRGEILLTNETEKLCFCPRWQSLPGHLWDPGMGSTVWPNAFTPQVVSHNTSHWEPSGSLYIFTVCNGLQSIFTVIITHSVLQGILLHRQVKNYFSFRSAGKQRPSRYRVAQVSPSWLLLILTQPMGAGSCELWELEKEQLSMCLRPCCAPGWYVNSHVTFGHYRKFEFWLWGSALAFLGVHSSDASC